MPKHEFDYDLIVIGSGAGGSLAATIAAEKGKRVAIIESGVFGGEAANFSDVPINALLHAANIYDEAKHAGRFGLRSSMIGYNYPSIRDWKDLAVRRTGAGGNRRYYENRGINTFCGSAHFLSPNEISVNRRHLSASSFLIATGAVWVAPNVPGLANTAYFTPRDIFETIRPPKTLLIIGGGESGVEIAQLMAIFGTKVYIAEQSDRILPVRDKEVGETIARILTDQKGVTCLTYSKVVAVEKDGFAKRVILSRAGTEKSIRVDEILVAAGRMPTMDLGLENAGVKYTENGITVNNFLQTSNSHIYAAGDCIGHNSHTHTALLESQVAVNNIFRRSKISLDYLSIPEVVFTNPGIASVGLSEEACLKRRMSVKTAVAPINIIARSNTSDCSEGFVKIIVNGHGVIVGASIVAPHAGEMIQELVLAVQFEMTAKDIANTPHAFLTWSEAIRVAASKLC